MQHATEDLDQAISLMMSRSDLKKIDDIRFEQRASSRASVIRDLIKKGMKVEGQK